MPWRGTRPTSAASAAASASSASRTSGWRSRGDDLVEGQPVHGPEGRVGDERVERALEPEQHPGRAGGHLRGDAGAALVVDPRRVGQRIAEGLRCERRLRHRVGDVDAPRGERLRSSARSGSSERSSETNWNRPRPTRCQRVADDGQLVVDGERARHVAVLRPVQDRARRREARGLRRARRRRPHRRCADTRRRSGRPRGPARRARRRGPRRGAPGCRDRSCDAWRTPRRGTGRRSPTRQSMPSCSAVPGMSSTPSMTSTRKSSAPGRTGANPTPQLPITAVVTPWCADGAISASQIAWPS